MTPAPARTPERGELLVATRNAGKARELRALLAPLGQRAIDLREAGIEPARAEDDLEDALTFEENALAKARYFAGRSGGRATVADDSGLCVLALSGAPGVHSRRYSGGTGDEAQISAANSAKLLREMAGVSDRRAEFVCAIAYVAGREEFAVTGRAAGLILESPRGTHGFGYDALFWSDNLACSYGEASPAQKAQVSHRAIAVAQLVALLSAARAETTTSR